MDDTGPELESFEQPAPPPSTISAAERSELGVIAAEAKELWARLRGLEERAYAITKEQNPQGFTTDLVWSRHTKVEDVLRELNITVT